MIALNRLFGRQADADDDALDRLANATVNVTNVRFGFPEPIVADVTVMSDWGELTLIDVGLKDPDGEARVVAPWVMRPQEATPEGKRRGGWSSAVVLSDELRAHLRTVLLDLWARRER